MWEGSGPSGLGIGPGFRHLSWCTHTTIKSLLTAIGGGNLTVVGKGQQQNSFGITVTGLHRHAGSKSIGNGVM